MIDKTLDIAIEHFLALKVTDKELQELEDFYAEEEKKRQERIKQYKGMSDMEIVDQAFSEHTNDDNVVANGISPNNYSEIGTETDYQRELDSQPEIMKRIRNMMEYKYYKDKRLKWSNQYYWGTTMSVVIGHYAEKRSHEITALDIAHEMIEKNKDFIQDRSLEYHGEYPKDLLMEFKNKIQALNRGYTWHSDEDGALTDIFAVAYHHNQEIPADLKHNSKLKLIINKFAKPIVYFSLGFCIIPYTIQELIILIMALTNPTQAINTIGSLREWITKNGGKYFLMMYTFAILINWFIIRRFIH